MKVPEYTPQVNQAGVPNARQNANVGSFVNSDAAMLGRAGEQVANSFENAAFKEMQHKKQLQQEQIDKANKIRVLDTANQLAQYDQDKEFGDSGWRNVRGKDVFLQQNSKPLTDNVIEERSKFISQLSSGLGSEDQRQQFQLHANETSLRLRGQLLQHEGEQHRVYTAGTLQTGIDSEMKNISLNYNDHEGIAASIEKINQYSSELGNVNGHGSDAGKLAAQGHISNALKSASIAAIEHGNHTIAQSLNDSFSDHLDAQDRIAIQSKIVDSWAANEAQTNPQNLYDLTSDHLSQVKRGILGAEGGSDTFNADGSPTVSSDGLSIGTHQVTDKTAKDPGFGIKPASARTHAEYNRIGDELIGKLYEKYDGDALKVAAAYNAGAGAVDKAVKQYGDNWQEGIPSSTRTEYLPRFGEKIKTGTPVDYMSNVDRLQKHTLAKSQMEHGKNQFAIELKSNINNQYAQAESTGSVSEEIRPEQFTQAFGEKGAAEYADYKDKIEFGKTFFSVAKLPVKDFQTVLEQAKPREGADFAREQKQYELLQQAYAHASKQRETDPIAWAQNNGYQITPISSGNLAQSLQEITNRTHIAEQMKEAYGVSALLSKDETASLSDILSKGTEAEQMQLLQGLRMRLPNDYHGLVQQLRPDSPATKIAGHLIGEGSDELDGTEAAKMILRGEKLLNPTADAKKENGNASLVQIPKDFNSTFYETVGDVFGGDMETTNQALQAARAHYIATAQDKASISTDSETFDNTIKAVLGGTMEHADAKVLLPYGMNEEKFKDDAFKQFKDQTGMSLAEFNRMPLYGRQDGTYLINNGNAYLFGKDGNLVVIKP